jgi:NADH dehydrogenase
MEFATQLYQDMVASPLPAVGFFVGSQPKTGQIMMSPAYIGDVAQAIVNALSNPSTVGQTYAIGGPEALSWNDMIMRIAATVNRRKFIIPMPIGVMKMAATLLDRLPAFPVTRDQLTMLAENNVADPADLRKLADRELTAFNVDSLAYLKQENPS